MDWNTLLTFALGGLTAVIPIIISNGYQAREKNKDRVEQRREAKTQLALELMRNDIKTIEDGIDENLRAVDSINTLSLKKHMGKLESDSVIKEMQSMTLDSNSKHSRLGESELISEKLAHTLGADFYSEYIKFDDLCLEFWKMSASSPYLHENVGKARIELSISAGKLHAMMNEKLISLRD